MHCWETAIWNDNYSYNKSKNNGQLKVQVAWPGGMNLMKWGQSFDSASVEVHGVLLLASHSESSFICGNNKLSSMCFSMCLGRKVNSVTESQTDNCVFSGKFQDSGYLMKILSLDSFPMWCQNCRRVNVWTVFWRATLNLPWVCVSPAQVSGVTVFISRPHLPQPLQWIHTQLRATEQVAA